MIYFFKEWRLSITRVWIAISIPIFRLIKIKYTFWLSKYWEVLQSKIVLIEFDLIRKFEDLKVKNFGVSIISYILLSFAWNLMLIIFV
jgi:hypothetical protein